MHSPFAHMCNTLCVDKDNIYKLWWTENSTSLVLAEPTSSPSPSLYLCILALAQHCFSVGAGCSCSGQKAASQEV